MAYVKQRGEDTYLVRIMIGTDENGRPIQKSRTFHPSTSGLSKSKLQKEIDAFVEKFENEFSTDVPHADKITQNDLADNAPPSDVVIPSKRVERPVVAPILPKMNKIETIPTFAEFCEDYRQVKMKLLSPTCWQLYENVLTKYFIPMFGQMRLNEIRPSHVQKAIDFFTSPEGRTDGRGEVLKPPTIRRYYVRDESGVKVDGDLRLGIPFQNGIRIGIHIMFDQSHNAVGNIDCHWKHTLTFGICISEYDPLISGTDEIIIAVHGFADLRRLLGEKVDNIADTVTELPCHTVNNGFQVNVCVGLDLTGDNDGLSLYKCFHSASAVSVLPHTSGDDCIADLIGILVRVKFGDGFGGKQFHVFSSFQLKYSFGFTALKKSSTSLMEDIFGYLPRTLPTMSR